MTLKRVNHLGWIVVSALVCIVLTSSGQVVSARLATETLASPRVALDVTPTPTLPARTHTVAPGDSLWTIAVKFYGDGTRYVLIQQANDLPPNTRLRTGQVLVIPFLETENPSTPVPTLPVATALPTPRAATPTLVAPTAPPAAFPQPTFTSAPPSNPAAPSDASNLTLILSATGFILNVLGVICLLGSLLCGLLSYDLYRRARRLARRRYISNRVQAGL